RATAADHRRSGRERRGDPVLLGEAKAELQQATTAVGPGLDVDATKVPVDGRLTDAEPPTGELGAATKQEVVEHLVVEDAERAAGRQPVDDAHQHLVGHVAGLALGAGRAGPTAGGASAEGAASGGVHRDHKDATSKDEPSGTPVPPTGIRPDAGAGSRSRTLAAPHRRSGARSCRAEPRRTERHRSSPIAETQAAPHGAASRSGRTKRAGSPPSDASTTQAQYPAPSVRSSRSSAGNRSRTRSPAPTSCGTIGSSLAQTGAGVRPSRSAGTSPINIRDSARSKPCRSDASRGSIPGGGSSSAAASARLSASGRPWLS